MRIRFEKSGQNCDLPDKPFAGGGEGDLYRLPDPAAARSDIAVKIYRKPTREHASKLRAMLANPPVAAYTRGHVFIAWPTEQIVRPSGSAECIGYAMPFVPNARPIADLYNPKYRKLHFPEFTDADLLRTAKDLAAAFRSVHRQGHAIGDVNELNILLNQQGRVILIDTDSFQIIHQGKVHRCVVGKMEYTPPELLGKRSADIDRAPMHDNFALGVILFQLLMGGFHPFAGVYTGSGDPPPTETVIKNGHWPFSAKRHGPFRPPLGAPSFGTLAPEIQKLFCRCFEDGVDHPGRRPDAGDWEKGLTELSDVLTPIQVVDQQAAVDRAVAERRAERAAIERAAAEEVAKGLATDRATAERNAAMRAVQRAEAERIAEQAAVERARAEKAAADQAVQRAESERVAAEQVEQRADAERIANERKSRNVSMVKRLFFWLGCLVGLAVLCGILYVLWKSPNTKQEQTSPAKNETNVAGATISPDEAYSHIGQECTVIMVIESNHEFDWALILNSKKKFSDPGNFQVPIVKKTAGKNLDPAGIKEWNQKFSTGTRIRVTGKVEEYTDPKTKNIRYQLKVDNLEQIRVR